MIDVHGHILRNPDDLDWIIDTGLIEKAWLLALPEMPQSYGEHEVVFGTDDEVLETAHRYPDFFLPFAYLDFRREAAEIDRHRDRGFVGLKAIFAPRPYDDDAYMEHYARAAALKMPILFHTGGLGAISSAALGPGLSTRSTHMRPCQLGTICGEFPDLVCVGAHLGQSWHQEVLECMRCYPNLYFDISGGDTVFVMRWLLNHLGEPTVCQKLLTGIDAVYGRRNYHEDILEMTRFWHTFFKACGLWFEWTDQAERILHLNAAAIHDRLGIK